MELRLVALSVGEAHTLSSRLLLGGLLHGSLPRTAGCLNEGPDPGALELIVCADGVHSAVRVGFTGGVKLVRNFFTRVHTYTQARARRVREITARRSS